MLRKIIKDEQHKDAHENKGGESVHIGLYALLGHREYSYRQSLEARTAGKIADDKVIERERESHYHAGDDAGHYRGQYDLEERLSGSAAEILRRLYHAVVKLRHDRVNRHYHIRQEIIDHAEYDGARGVYHMYRVNAELCEERIDDTCILQKRHP